MNYTWSGETYDINKPNGMNEVFGNLEGKSVFYTKLAPDNRIFCKLATNT